MALWRYFVPLSVCHFPMRSKSIKTLNNPPGFKSALLSWAQQFREVILLDSNDFPQKYSSFDAIFAVDALTSIQTDSEKGFEKLAEYRRSTADWIFGYLTYDLKNDTEDLASKNFDGLHFPDLFFFQPKKLFLLKGDKLEMQYLKMCDDEIESDFDEILKQIGAEPTERLSPVSIMQRIPKKEYLSKVSAMLAHIHRGDIYEANFCMEFYAENASVEPANVFRKLNANSRPPFAAYFKNGFQYAICASPERYLRKTGTSIISQPIKGTSKRNDDAELDNQLRDELSANEKERSENIMITDLVRNDLSKTALKNSVVVEELCGVYSFEHVHHLISTITSESDADPVEILRTTFPMGSMTGAPKISAMKIIEKLEETKRGLYSGAIGYFTPNGNFDFNVVIRSILYNAKNQYLSYSAGSAITAKSDPEKEYEECLLKADAIMNVLTQQ